MLEPILLVQYGLLGMFAGFLGGWLGVGGGALIVPMLCIMFKVDTKIAIGTSLAAIVPIAISASLRHFAIGNVNLKILWPMAIGGVVGAVCGTWMLQRSSPELAKRALAVFLVYSAVRLWMSSMPKA